MADSSWGRRGIRGGSVPFRELTMPRRLGPGWGRRGNVGAICPTSPSAPEDRGAAQAIDASVVAPPAPPAPEGTGQRAFLGFEHGDASRARRQGGIMKGLGRSERRPIGVRRPRPLGLPDDAFCQDARHPDPDEGGHAGREGKQVMCFKAWASSRFAPEPRDARGSGTHVTLSFTGPSWGFHYGCA
jgi:hypothetical protein